MKLALAFLVAGFALAEDAQPPKIDYKLQFEARTLEGQARELQRQFSTVQAAYAAKIEAMKKACGAYDQAVDPQTTEYICIAKPESPAPTRNPSGTWKGVKPPTPKP